MNLNHIDKISIEITAKPKKCFNCVYSLGCILNEWSSSKPCSTARCPLQWRQNELNGVWNHWCHGCLLNRLFRHRSKKTSKLRITGLCAGNYIGPVTRKMFPFDDVIMAYWTIFHTSTIHLPVLSWQRNVHSHIRLPCGVWWQLIKYQCVDCAYLILIFNNLYNALLQWKRRRGVFGTTMLSTLPCSASTHWRE